MPVSIRPATHGEIPALERLIPESVRALQKQHCSVQQMQGALGTVLGVDTQLIQAGTYLLAEADSKVIACGRWSKRKTLFGSNRVPGKDDTVLNPVHDAARIRAFFVHPDWARQGIGSRILQACEAAATAQGFTRFELGATLSGALLPRPRIPAHGQFRSLPFQRRVPPANSHGEAVATPTAYGGYCK